MTDVYFRWSITAQLPLTLWVPPEENLRW